MGLGILLQGVRVIMSTPCRQIRISAGVNILFFLGNSTQVADFDLSNSTQASKAIFNPIPHLNGKLIGFGPL